MPHRPSCSCTHPTCTRSHPDGYRLYSTLRRAMTRLEAERDEQQRGRPDA